jgi:recombination protein RecA
LTQSALDSLEVANSLKKIFKVEENVFGVTPYFLHSGHYGLDYIISGIVDGSGGWPGGQVVEVFGPRSTGKTLLLIYAVKEMQKLGGVTIVADVEHRWNKEFVVKHGVDWDRLVGWSPATVEQFTVQLMDALEELPDDGKVLVTLDSLASLSLIKEVEDKGTKADQGRKAQRLRAAMRVLPSIMTQKGVILMVANHVTEKVGVMYGPTQTTPGGTGVPFQATVRIELMRTQPIKLEGKERPIGVTLNVKCDKNSQTAPFGETSIDMLWSKGINPYSGLVDMAKDLEIVDQKGAWYSWNGMKFNGDKELAEGIRNNIDEFLKDPKWKSPYFME